MFVQIDELPSMYSRPRLSRSSAPCPSTKTSGSWSGAHHSGMFVNGCQTNRLSASINASVFQSVMRASFLESLNSKTRCEQIKSSKISSSTDYTEVSICESFQKLQIPIPKFQVESNYQIPKRTARSSAFRDNRRKN